MKKQKGFTAIEALLALLAVASVIGWTWNIVKIVQTGLDVFTGMLIARVVGVFVAPLGAVLGYL